MFLGLSDLDWITRISLERERERGGVLVACEFLLENLGFFESGREQRKKEVRRR
jgi:hypothetical protein